MKNPVFTGAAVAIITPMNDDFSINYDEFKKFIDFQIDNGTDAIVICGTTGESSTLKTVHHLEAIKFCVDYVNGRVPVIAGAGSNNTECGLEIATKACEYGVDALLLVTPYYNKCTQKGLIKHYTMYHDATNVPIILYNVPSRTGVNIEPETYARLAEHPMITGIKEANGNIAKIVETKALVGDKLDIWSGNDDQIVPILAAGGSGVISVLSNVLPKKTVELCNKFFAGDVKGSMDMQCEMFDLIKALFCEVNPIPAKAAVAALGYCENYVRLPLTPMEKQHEEVLLECMRKQGLKV